MPPKPQPRPSSSSRRPQNRKRGPLEWAMLILGLTVLAGATTCLLQSIQCNCSGRPPCSQVPRCKRTLPCLADELYNFYTKIKETINDLLTPKHKPPDRCE